MCFGGGSNRVAAQARGTASQHRVSSVEVPGKVFTPFETTFGGKPATIATEEQYKKLSVPRQQANASQAYKDGTVMQVTGVSAAPPPDETSLRIKTRAARAGVANPGDAPLSSKKTKRRGGLRIDTAASVSSGGSGVIVPN